MNRFTRFTALAALAVGFVQSSIAAVETYTIDPVHSSLGFSIRHFVSKVPGTFTKFSGTITVDRDNLEHSSVEATIDVGSVNTANEKRDNHLKSPDFFDVANHGTASFKSKSWKKTGEDTFDIVGDLTLHGVTKEVVLQTNLLGFGEGARGAQLSGWEATTTIKKSDFGVSGPAMLAKTLGDEVTVKINIEAGKKS
ncbi:YceI family protein [Opitutus terrae]|uniref:YceI family protein n=1 Tax=Opitutus terrae (strain DSM 11246 / JCM 15787 / PB90-1) TaxID=452637 RepID=B1ZYT0_OPITP|nr:YceI family protein [Opitutus terrae]ACB75319.1 YceI family protein [Opitutus terrae PB90-1]